MYAEGPRGALLAVELLIRGRVIQDTRVRGLEFWAAVAPTATSAWQLCESGLFNPSLARKRTVSRTGTTWAGYLIWGGSTSFTLIAFIARDAPVRHKLPRYQMAGKGAAVSVSVGAPIPQA